MVFFPIITIVIITGLTRYLTKSWLAPGTFFALCWSFFLIVPLIFAPEYKTSLLGVWYVVIFVMSFTSGSIVAFNPLTYHLNQKNELPFYFNYKLLFKILFTFSLISALGLYMLLNYASSIYTSENYVNSYLTIPNLISIDRYRGTLEYPLIIKYSLYFIYPSNLVGGLIFGLYRIPKLYKILSIIPLIEAILLGIIEGARTSILLGLIVFFSSYLSVTRYNNKSLTNKISYLKIIMSSGTFIILFTIFFILIQWLRQGMDGIIVDLLVDRIRSYFFGYLSAFTQWVSSSSVEQSFNLGLITFAGPFNLIGILDRPLGFYSAINISNGVSTNIFTAFRGIITDFSITGSILIAFIIGFITQLIYQKDNNKTLLGTLPISMFYAFTLYSPLISIFHYNSILFSWLMLFIILFIVKNEPLDNYC